MQHLRVAASLMLAATVATGLAVPSTASAMAPVAITAGTLSITAPTSAPLLGSTTLGLTATSISGVIGATLIDDGRVGSLGWTMSIAASNFSDGSSHTIAAAQLKVYIAAGNGPFVTTGLALPVTSHSTSLTALQLSTSPQPFMTATTTSNSEVSYNPTLVVNVGTSTYPGTYTGTITQSVS